MQQLSFIPCWLIPCSLPQDEPPHWQPWPQVSWFTLSAATKLTNSALAQYINVKKL